MKNLSVSLPCLWLAGILSAPAAAILAPGDPIFGYDLDTNGSFPDAEGPGNVTDGNSGTKYLNRGNRHSGVIITPGAASIARSFTATTANDSPDRDPSSYLLFGTNAPITSASNSSGFDDDWTLIGGGALSLSNDRFSTSAPVDLTNTASWSSYWMVFPNYKNEAQNLMQIADLQFFTELSGAGSAILAAGNPAVATSWDGNFPAGESAANIIDGTSGQKYLNFGKENSSFWVVPSMGPSIVQSFSLTTANDAPERDPASFRLLGQADDGSWNLIDAGPLSLTDDREVESDPIVVANATAYNAYRMEFDSLKDSGTANSMQIGEVQFFDVVPEPSSTLLAAGGLLGLLARRKRR